MSRCTRRCRRIASGCDGDIADELLKILRRGGIEIHLSCLVLGIEGETLRYQDATGARTATRRRTSSTPPDGLPSSAVSGLEEAGVDVSARGIRVDAQGRTNVPNIWACGDVTGRHMLAHVAVREGIVAVNSMFGRPDRMRYDAIPAVIYSHPEVAMVGRTEEELKAAGIDYRKAVVPMALAGRFLVEHVRETGIVKVLAGAAHGEILGVHAIGDLSSEFIVAAGAMIEAEMTLAAGRRGHLPAPDRGRGAARERSSRLSDSGLGENRCPSPSRLSRTRCFVRVQSTSTTSRSTPTTGRVAEESARFSPDDLRAHLARHVRDPRVRDDPQRDQDQGRLQGRHLQPRRARAPVDRPGGRGRGHGLLADARGPHLRLAPQPRRDSRQGVVGHPPA